MRHLCVTCHIATTCSLTVGTIDVMAAGVVAADVMLAWWLRAA
jgi:hypothetical protein